MRRTRLIIPVILLFSAVAAGQTPADGVSYDFRSRTSAGIEWKIIKGLSVDAGYELRTADMFSRVERHQVNAGFEYSPIKHLDIATGYYFIAHFNGEKEYKPQHRIYFDLEGSYTFGAWKLSLRERIQMTNKAYGFNEYQQPRNLVELKSRLKVAYKGFIHLEPYAYVELRNCFNGASFTADYNGQSGKYSNYEFTGYDDAYINRIRGTLGLKWKISRNHSIDFKFMTDWCRDKIIDTNAKGTKLKAYYWEQAVNNSLSIGYVFSF